VAVALLADQFDKKHEVRNSAQARERASLKAYVLGTLEIISAQEGRGKQIRARRRAVRNFVLDEAQSSGAPSSRTIATLELAPTRLAPASIMARKS
jgi:hypothetical protein